MSMAIASVRQMAVSIDSGHGPLHGLLTLPAQASALVVLTHAGSSPEARDEALAVILRHAGIGTLTLDLLTPGEERFEDNHHNVPQLAKRLLDGLLLIKQRMLTDQLPKLPIGLCAAGDCSPVVLRVAAQRDQDIFAIVCRGGLIDLAGMMYLHLLASPILVLVGKDDDRRVASTRRALRELACPNELKLLPASADSPDSGEDFESVARETAHWFVRHLPRTVTAATAPVRA